MSTNHTANYNLCQWEATDQVLRTDFNQDNAKIDAALGELAGRDRWEFVGEKNVTYEPQISLSVPVPDISRYRALKLFFHAAIYTGQDLILRIGDLTNTYITLDASGTSFTTSTQFSVLQTTGEGGGMITLFPFGVEKTVGVAIDTISKQGSSYRAIRSMGCKNSTLWSSITILSLMGYNSTVDVGSRASLYGLL